MKSNKMLSKMKSSLRTPNAKNIEQLQLQISTDLAWGSTQIRCLNMVWMIWCIRIHPSHSLAHPHLPRSSPVSPQVFITRYLFVMVIRSIPHSFWGQQVMQKKCKYRTREKGSFCDKLVLTAYEHKKRNKIRHNGTCERRVPNKLEPARKRKMQKTWGYCVVNDW